MNRNLVIARKENNMKQSELAELLGITRQSYHLKETGKSHFTIPEAKRLTRIFNCTLNDLFGGAS